MNKAGLLSIFAVVCSAASTHALNKSDLEKAIRTLDIEAVRQIVTTEKFTPKESERYLDLASQMINDRKFTIQGSFFDRDAITSCDKSKADKAEFERRTALILFAASGSSFLLPQDRIPSSGSLLTATALLIAGATFLVKSYYTFSDYLNKELRPKHNDAITIKQLIYSARVE